MAKTDGPPEQPRNSRAALINERLLYISHIDVMRGASGKIITKRRSNQYIADKLRLIDCIDEQLIELGEKGHDINI